MRFSLFVILFILANCCSSTAWSQQSDQPVDESKITHYEPSPKPESTVTPLEPSHRIAAQASSVPISAAHFEKARRLLDDGLTYLLSQQDDAGLWMPRSAAAATSTPHIPSPVRAAATAMVIKAMVQEDPQWIESDEYARAMGALATTRRSDGAFDGGALTNYVTSVVVGALSTIDNDPQIVAWRDEALAWLRHGQWDENEGLDPTEDWYGGAGYGNHGRPDLSNTQMLLDAMYDAGVKPDEPAMQRALSFVSRCQNVQETNNAPWAGNDGGFVYTCANNGESMASEYAGDGRYGELLPSDQPRSLRSYGSMTYAGFKSLLYAGLSPDDIRVQSAYEWIRNHWTFDQNPGLGEQGLYYYYHSLARALRVSQQHTILDGNQHAHNWREELIDALADRQRNDGSWQNSVPRWMEGEPVMATIFATLALEEALKPVEIPLAEQPDDEHAPGLLQDDGIQQDAELQAGQGPLHFMVTYDPSVTDSYTGRVYIMLGSESNQKPRSGPNWYNPQPMFGVDVVDWLPNTPLLIGDENLISFPNPMGKLPAGTYSMQAVMRPNPDSPFLGSGVDAAFSTCKIGPLDGNVNMSPPLHIDTVIPPLEDEVPELLRMLVPDERRLQPVLLRSAVLSEHHGRDIFMEAAILLPEGYDESNNLSRAYPVLYFISGADKGHYSMLVNAAATSSKWKNDIIKVAISGLCASGHHLCVDSEYNGPWGTAIATELIPHIENIVRIQKEAYARSLAGIDAGGWASLWLLIQNPEFFGAAHAVVPDVVDFRDYQGVNLYEPGINLYIDDFAQPRPMAKFPNRRLWFRDIARAEYVKGRGSFFARYEAAFSPVGPDGMPMEFFNRRTGIVNNNVTEAWRRFDISHVLASQWNTLGPSLNGKINIYVGDDDNFLLDNAVAKLRDILQTLKAKYHIEIEPGKDHSGMPSNELFQRFDRELYFRHRTAPAKAILEDGDSN